MSDTPAEHAPPPSTAHRWPLFYRDPVALSSQQHAHWRLRPGSADFVAQAHAVPLMLGEFAAASRHYPIVFGGDAAAPLALLGLQADDNRFVADARWRSDTYVPAYVRRYPFVAVQGEGDARLLAIDAAAPMLVTEGDEGQPLFEDGEPSALTRDAMAFCELVSQQDTETRAFGAALREAGLLLPRQASVSHADGRQQVVDGFEVIDAARLQALDDARVLDWHRRGWLASLHHHLASLARFPDLLPDAASSN